MDLEREQSREEYLSLISPIDKLSSDGHGPDKPIQDLGTATIVVWDQIAASEKDLIIDAKRNTRMGSREFIDSSLGELVVDFRTSGINGNENDYA